MRSTSKLVLFCCALTLVALRILYLRAIHEDTMKTFQPHVQDGTASDNFTSPSVNNILQDTMKTFKPFQPHVRDGTASDNFTSPSVNNILVNLTKAVTEVSDQYLSVTIDACAIWENWVIINFTSPSVINMAKGLYPAMLRLGGTPENFVIFKPNQNLPVKNRGSQSDTTGVLVNCYPKKFVNFPMNTAQWDAVNEFVKATGLEFIYGLNILFRTPDGAWNYSNPEELMRYTASKGYPINWGLGNEPGNFPRVAGFPISPAQLAKDYATLKTLMKSITPSAVYLTGPDSEPNQYMEQFLKSVEDGVINAATWHHYYTSGRSATLPQFFSVHLLDSFINQARKVRNTLDKFHPDIELWLGETSSAYTGGAPGLSNSYVAGFMWLDKLGIAALMNHSRVFRQSFVGVSYSLLDSGQHPLPDYWLSVLYKRLVGTKVLYVFNSLKSGRYIRAYTHCAKSPYPAGSVVLILLNLNTKDTKATLANTELASSSRDVYWLTPPGNSTNVLSKQVTLNGHLLQLVGDQLPELQPEGQEAKDSIFLPALSFGFHVFKDVKAPACM